MTSDFEEEFLRIEKQLKEIQAAFQFIEKTGLDREILIAFIKHRTGLGKQQILEILDAQDEFFKKLAKLMVKPK